MEEADVELVRYWRNHPTISSKMEYRNFISRSEHLKWFEAKKNDKYAFAFIIEVDETSVGIIHSANKNSQSEGGMFIWDNRYTESHIPVVVSLMLTDLSFYFLSNETLYAKILKDNYNSINFNKKLGYKLADENDTHYNQLYYLDKQEYQKASISIKETLFRYYGRNDVTTLILNDKDKKNKLIEGYVKYSPSEFSELSEYFKIIYEDN